MTWRRPDVWDLFVYVMGAMTAAAWILVLLFATGVI